jgi:hypothetical protein
MQISSRKVRDKIIEVRTDRFVSANLIEATVGTNCPQGGDSGHGGLTVLVLRDAAGTDIECRLLPNDRDGNGGVEITLGGDTECETFADALIWAGEVLKAQMKPKN